MLLTSTYHRVLAVLAAAAFALTAFCIHDVVADRNARLESARVLSETMAESGAQRLAAHLEPLEQILIEAAALFPESGAVPPDILEPLHAKVMAHRDIRALSYVNADGILTQIRHKHLAAPKLPVDVSGRSHYQQQRMRHGDNKTALSPPAPDKLMHRPAWFMSRPILTADGRFNGLVALVLETDVLTKSVASLTPVPHHTAGIMSTEGYLFAQANASADDVGHSVSDTPLFSAASDPTVDASALPLPGLSPDKAHVTAVAAVPGFPLTVYAGIERRAWLEQWARAVWLHAAAGVFFLTLFAYSGWLIVREHQRSRLQQVSLGQDRESDAAAWARKIETKAEELKKSLAALGESEERFRLFADISPLPLIVTRRSDGIVLYINASAAEVFQVPQEQAYGKVAPNFWKHPSDRARMIELLTSGGRVRNLEAPLLRADGQEFTALLSAAVGKLQGETMILVSLMDISERKRLESELARSNAELEQFSIAASHDLQEPLRMVSGFIGMIQRRYADQLDEQGRDYVAFAVDGAARMSRLIADLLDYARVHQQDWRFAKVSLNECVAGACKNLETAVHDSQAVLDTADLPAVLGDSTQIMRVFQNLIGNSLKYRSPDRPPRISIYADRQDGLWRISVADNGLGLDSDSARSMFLPFKRFHKSGEISGSGLGLALCRRIVEAHSGKIWARSPGLDRGLTVAFTLPAADPG